MERFVTVIHREAEGGFWAEVPALPGCYSQGETVAELMENLREAITGVLEVMKEDGKIPEEDIQVSISVHRHRNYLPFPRFAINVMAPVNGAGVSTHWSPEDGKSRVR